MAEKKYTSIFDIIGPVMIGPSSSHTAGAARIGNMARAIFGELPDSVHIYLYESFAKTYKGHGTNLALLGGLLGMKPDNPDIQLALFKAQDAGLEHSIIPLSDKAVHPNTARFVMRKGDRKMSVTGISIGGGNANITHIDDFELVIRNGVNTIVIYHNDVPGVIAGVSSLLSNHGINIASMKVWRKQRGKEASMVIEVDDLATQFDEQELLGCKGVYQVIYVGGESNGIN